MTRKLFNEKEIEMLLSNQYTKSCSPTTIKFTKSFAEIFWIKYLEHIPLKEIWLSLGYDPELLGIKRTEGFIYSLRKQKLTNEQRAEKTPKTSKIRRPPDGIDYSSMDTSDAIRTMQTELSYLKQEIEFLKKLLLWRRTGKGRPYGKSRVQI